MSLWIVQVTVMRRRRRGVRGVGGRINEFLK